MTADGPARQASLRRHNLAVVYQLIARSREPMSRAEIAQSAGLTRATATVLVDHLVGAGLAEELGARASGRAGRPATPVRLARGTLVGLGLEINVDYLGVRAVDLAGEVLTERVEHMDLAGSDPDWAVGHLAKAVRAVSRTVARRGARIAGAAVAVPGPVDRPRGPLRLAPNLGWADVDIAARLEPALEAPLVRVDNEASLAARAELAERHRAPMEHPGTGGFVYVSGGIGIGAGIVEAASLHTGTHGWAGELGHVAVYPDGRPCRCGSVGCLETYAGRRAIAAAAGLPAEAGAEAIAARATAGDPAALAALAEAGAALGIALAGAVNLLDIPAVVLGADLAVLAPFLTEAVAGQLRRRVLAARWSDAGPAVHAALAPDLPALTGAALAVTDGVGADPAAYLAGAG